MNRVLFTIMFVLVTLSYNYAQDGLDEDFVETPEEDTTAKEEDSKYVSFYRHDDPMNLEIAPGSKSGGAAKKKKKKKKNVHFGIKTRKGFRYEGIGDRRVVEVFNYLKVYEDPNPYVRNHYWYDIQKGKIQKSKKIKQENARILHGPYEKKVGDVVVERGTYYKGTKHGRWEYFGKPRERTYHKGDSAREVTVESQTLLKKEYWYKGWLKTTELTYFDLDRSLVKEAIPYNEDKERHGYYASFFKDGAKKEFGMYEFGQKIGKWYEYQKMANNRTARKKIIQYKSHAYGEDVPPLIVKEWNEKGELIIENGKPAPKKKRRTRGGRRR